jgi:hypothetical protein
MDSGERDYYAKQKEKLGSSKLLKTLPDLAFGSLKQSRQRSSGFTRETSKIARKDLQNAHEISENARKNSQIARKKS